MLYGWIRSVIIHSFVRTVNCVLSVKSVYRRQTWQNQSLGQIKSIYHIQVGLWINPWLSKERYIYLPKHVQNIPKINPSLWSTTSSRNHLPLPPPFSPFPALPTPRSQQSPWPKQETSHQLRPWFSNWLNNDTMFLCRSGPIRSPLNTCTVLHIQGPREREREIDRSSAG